MKRNRPQTIAVLDYGSQYTQLIARRIRELNVFSEILPYDIDIKELDNRNVKGIILSGGPASVYDKDAPQLNKKLFKYKVPILGVCYGIQLLFHNSNGQVSSSGTREFGPSVITISNQNILFNKIPKSFKVWMSHGDKIEEINKDWDILALSNNDIIASISHKSKPFYGVQFHPEVTHTEFGREIISNFLFKICNLKQSWTPQNFIKDSILYIKETVGDGKVICGISGGVDSSVVGVLLNRALGHRCKGIFINHGLLRKEEEIEVMSTLKDELGINIDLIDHSSIFLKKLRGVINPEAKRKIIGEQFIRSFEEVSTNYSNITHLAQGTLYPDIIESGKSILGKSATIKSHHNVGGLPKRMKFQLIEPLNNLFKDEVRKIGRELGLPNHVVERHPFPGPGLAVRIIGDITEDRLKMLREADNIFIDILKNTKEYDKIWQAFCVLIPIKTVGVMGDSRTYENLICLRAVTSIDGMTAHWYDMNYQILEDCSKEIVNKVKGINRVVYDITSKPPGTIEWE